MTDRYAVFGNPVAHSKSPLIHAEFARQTGEDLSYEAILVPRDRFREAAAAFRTAGGCGANVTLPFKEDAYRLATQHSARAEAAKAVNTLSFAGDQSRGDNTDGVGLVTDLKQNLGYPIGNKRVLLLGAGGAARGVLLPLLMEKPSALVIANRTLARAHELKDEFLALMRACHTLFAGSLRAASFAELEGEEFDLLINATAASLQDEALALPRGVYAPGSLAYDMLYGRGITPFLASARHGGAAGLADGLGMLVEQAAESFFIWRGVRPQTDPVLRLLRPA